MILYLALLLLVATKEAVAHTDDSDLVFDDAEEKSNSIDGVGAFAVSPVASPLLEERGKKHRFVQILQDDDEDYIDDEGSTMGSGGNSTTITPTGPPRTPPKYYRMTINFTSIRYESVLNDRNSERFMELSQDIISLIEPLYDTMPGQQAVTVLKFEPSYPGSIGTVDLGTLNYYNDSVLRNVIYREISQQRLGRFAISPTGFSFRLVGGSQVEECPESEFKCGTEECIPFHQYCDGQVDCSDGSDEINCPVPRCRSDDQHQCSDGSCIDNARLCDGRRDCPGGEDEDRCGCRADEFLCDGNRCINNIFRCDGRYDCADLSDEPSDCHSTSDEATPCQSDQFLCSNGLCIEHFRRCDLVVDCPQGDDESFCHMKISVVPTEVNQYEGQSITFTCLVSSQTPIESIFWTASKHKQIPAESEVVSGIWGSRLTIYNLKITDEDSYICHAVTPTQKIQARSSLKVVVDLKIAVIPTEATLYERESTSFTCLVAARAPIVSVFWTASDFKPLPNRVELVSGNWGSRLTIYDLKLSDEDSYICHAWTHNQQIQATSVLKVVATTICPEGKFRCDDGECIDIILRCDGYPDCRDRSGADERNCLCTGLEQWQCDFGQCISRQLRCDGHIDCPEDDSDEKHCTVIPPPIPSPPPGHPVCTALQFRCSDGTCIANYLHCNGHVNCPDASDEKNCPCRPNQFTCDNGFCIEPHLKCNGISNCQDASDERDCPSRCAGNEFRCAEGTCIRDILRCNRQYDCPDYSDETNCPFTCRSDQFRCSNDVCLNIAQRCDRNIDCINGEDEDNCPGSPVTCPRTHFVCDSGDTCLSPSVKCNQKFDCRDGKDEFICDRCAHNEYVCNDGETCIPIQSKCNGRSDCPNGEDEVLEICTECTPGEFQCHDGTCIDTRLQCNGRYDCRDGSDERDCNGTAAHCSPYQFRCSNGECIAENLHCNGNYDCSDQSDEHDCPRCGVGKFTCRDGTCINENQRCNERPDCPDRTDEVDCEKCAEGFLLCKPFSMCLDPRRKCDGRADCPDHSDETNCDKCRSDEFECQNGQCIPKHLRCNGNVECSDRSDEQNCPYPEPSTCSPGSFQCRNGECISQRAHCDGKPDCSDRSDEYDCRQPSTCSPGSFQCRNGECISQRAHCDGKPDCSDRSDEYDCRPTNCEENEFQCDDGTCIGEHLHCDGVYDCRNFTDEQNCAVESCPPSQYRCFSGHCIDQNKHCDGSYDCPDQSDELDCAQVCRDGQFRCKNGECIPESNYCDGRFDCTDYSDETVCPMKGQVNLKTYPNTQTIHQGREVVFQCRDEGSQRLPVRWSRENNFPMPPSSTDILGRLTMPNIQPEYAGNYICTAIGVSPSTREAQTSVFLAVEPLPLTTTRSPAYCDANQATCHNGQCISKEYVCDGDLDCLDASDEVNCPADNECQPNEFLCESKKCILKVWQCDGDNDCLDKSDELNCQEKPGSQCHYGEYECKAFQQCIPKSYQCDGQLDCQDHSDEIGCAAPTIVSLPPQTVTVNAGEQVTFECIAIGTPTPIISWRLNWGHPPSPPRALTSSENGRGELIIRNVQTSDQGAYTCEAINSRESVMGTPDTILTVRSVDGVCLPPFFNIFANTQSNCLRCFCFGITDQCTSSSLYLTQMPPGTEISISAVSRSPQRTFNLQDSRYPLNQDIIDYRPASQEFRIDNRLRQGNPLSLLYYWTLPIQFLGNKLKSYGGNLRYQVLYRISGAPNPISAPDIILKGNGQTISFSNPEAFRPGIINTVEAKFVEGNWSYLDTETGRARSSKVNRESLMIVLQNVEVFLVRSVFDNNFVETSLISLTLDTAIQQETGQPRAALVEQCVCPPGYTGLSCEDCAPGFSRVHTGQYLGECRPSICNCNGHSYVCDRQGQCQNCEHNTEGLQCERCKQGYYGDARRGTANDCQPCPCPLTTASNQFSPTCFLDRDGQVTCDACQGQYQGRRCESCAPGYQGTPTIPGDSCRRAQDQCDVMGSLSPYPNPVTGLCQCKPSATGPRCNLCKANTFHLNPSSPTGCIDCFCMGITRNCSSSSLYRSKINVAFGNDPQGFALTTMEQSQMQERGLVTSPETNELTFYQFSNLARGRTYYWRLPSQFTGEKVTSYGGNLNYTVRYSSIPGAIPNREPDCRISGNRITLDYYHRQSLQPNSHNTITVPLFEDSWRRSDGQPATREHIMMALADLDAILIKATYASETLESSIKDISLETADNRYTGLPRAVEVEQCNCPVGYRGLSCEDCDVGHTRSGGGLYLGLCEPCFCNSHSSDCHAETGVCKNCQHNTEGDFCEVCKPGFDGDPSNGTPNDCVPIREEPCSCSIQGSLGLECDTRKQCPCKNHVQGRNCNHCKEGYFYLEARNPEGCTPCFCFGITERCTSSSYYRSQVRLQLQDARNHGVKLSNRNQDNTITDGFNVNSNRNEISTRNFPQRAEEVETLFWSLPEQFLGNKLTSYGGYLRFSQRYISRREGESYDDADVIIIGNGMSIYYLSSRPLMPDEGRTTEVELRETGWLQADASGNVGASRENFLMVLANVEAILIRSTFNSRMIDSVLGGVSLDVAVPQSTGQELASTVEQCTCPPGYTGLSCEECAPGFIRDQRAGPYLGRCTRCNCHGHSDSCDPVSGECQQCRHNTQGPSCEHCSNGYYGDPTRGSEDDCRPCPCPLTVPSNQFSATCALDSDGRPTCTACPNGYAGRNCELCAPGYRGNPRQVGDVCKPEGGPTITVRVEEPKVVRAQRGTTITFRCTGISQVSDVSYNIVWTRDGQALPAGSEDEGGRLTIYHVKPEDSGTYICTGSDLYSLAQDRATLIVSGDIPSTAPVVRIEPRYLEVQIGDPVKFQCIAEGYPPPSLQWTGGQNNQLSPFSSFRDGIFRIPAVQKSDEAEYFCTATNTAGTDSVRTILFVGGEQPATPPPPPPDDSLRVTIVPQTYTARAGETIRFDCRPASSMSSPRISWTKSGGQLPAAATVVGGMLTLPNIDRSYSGIYICTITSSIGVSQSQATLDILSTGPPSARIEPDQQTVSQGTVGELRCYVSGDPTPSVRWIKVGEELGAQHNILTVSQPVPDKQVIVSTLRIAHTVIQDRGVYVCYAENVEGIAQSSAILEVERREPPAIEIYPGTNQKINRGGSALFQCRATAGEPAPSIDWARVDGRPLTSTTEVLEGGVLRFNQVTGEEAGQYICTCKNEAGTVTSISTLAVEGLPIISLSSASPLHLTVGEHVYVECRAEGDPLPSVLWKQPRPADEFRALLPRETPGSAILEISQVRREDAGIYICRARSSAGTTEERLQLIVEDGHLTTPVIDTNREVFIAPEGSRAEMSCFVVDPFGETANVQLKWTRSDNLPMPANHAIRDGSLIINDVMKQDAGEYSCLGIENEIVIFSAVARLQVIAPPRITLNPVKQLVRPGDAVYIQCQATGDQPINIEWIKVGGALSPNVHTNYGLLEFRGITVHDAGRYLCRAQNIAGTAEGVAEVVVNAEGGGGCGPTQFLCSDGSCVSDDRLCSPVENPGCFGYGAVQCSEEPFVTIPRRELNVFIGSSVDLQCDVSGSPRPATQWTKEAGELPINSRVVDTTLRISSVRIEDAGRYFCTATNDAGSSRDYVTLNVQGLSSLTVRIVPTLDIVRMGDTQDVFCEVTGDEAAMVSWSRVGGSLPDNVRTVGNRLHFSNVQPENGGIYRCHVTTHTGTYTEDYVLAMQAIPSLPQNAAVETRTAPHGSSVVMECSTNLNPPVNYVWTKQGGILPMTAIVTGAVLDIRDVRAEDAGTYVCTAQNVEGSVDVPTILVVTGVVPYFAQAPVSYMAFPTLPDAYLNFDIDISFKPESSDGLILYNGQLRDGGGDFISFGLTQGFAEFRFDVGSGPAIIRSDSPLDIGKWHSVKLSRSKKEAMMVVDNNYPVNGSVIGRFQGLDLTEPFYVGSVPDFADIHKQNGFTSGFVGCISRLVIGNVAHELVRDAQVTSGVTTCETCVNNPCINGGVCQAANNEIGYICICPPGFSGTVCEKVGEACYPGVCNTGRCINRPEGGFNCYCPFGKGGLRCEKDIEIYEPAFRDDAFIAYETPNSQVLKRLKLVLRFKPRDLKDGILLYCAQSEKGHGDFISITIKDRHIEFRFDTGSGPAILQSKEKLEADEWTKVTAERNLREGTLVVNDGEEIRGKSPGHTRGLNLRLPLYVGGIDKHRISVSPFVEVSSGFDGCISHMEVSDVEVNLINAVIDSANVDDCGGQTSCDRQPCLNGGLCQELGPNPNDYSCICQAGFSGKDCEIEEDVCEVLRPCLHGGVCIGTGNAYRCNCPLGYGGANCGETVDFSESANFVGDGYLELSRELLPHTTSTVNEVISLYFETIEPNGLILWHGQKPNEDGKGQDYLALAIVDGFLEFSYELGSGPAQIRSPVRVDDGKRHKVVLKRLAKEGSLELDDVFAEYESSQGVLQMLNSRGNIYLGGLPNLNSMTANKYIYGFNGCIHDVEIQDSGILELQFNALSGSNVGSCDSDSEEEDSSIEHINNMIPK